MSFQQGLSGLNAASKNLEVIGNNVANANTYGDKTARAEFADLYASALNGSGNSAVGIGVTVAAVSQQFTQGNITPTGNPLDLAINGNGFFQVQDPGNQTLYTRNGQFKVDNNGFIVNDQNNKLLGYNVDALGNVASGTPTPLKVPTDGDPPEITDKIDMQFNLDARESATDTSVSTTVDFADKRTFNEATSATVYDAQGNDYPVTFYFQKTSAKDPTTGGDVWNVYATADGNSVQNDASGNPKAISQLVFSADGSTITSPAGGKVNFNPFGVIPAVNDPNKANLSVSVDLSNSTEFGAAYGVTNLVPNGNAFGQLTGISVDDSGMLVARYSNGASRNKGQLELANFVNPQGLQAIGGNAWRATPQSGPAHSDKPGTGNLGSMQSGALEESNVDLTAELVSMITAQRDYQANAQTIKTEDQAMQTLVNLR
jgi:flagellar hook protein FlgE